MTKKLDDTQVTGNDQAYLTVTKHQADREDDLNRRAVDTAESLQEAISDSEDLVKAFGMPLPARPGPKRPAPVVAPQRSWRTILAEAEANASTPIGLSDLLSRDEIEAVESRLSLLRSEFDAVHRLDGVDWAIAGVAGTLAALVDVFLVKLPRSPGFLGGPRTEGGSLSNFIRDRLKSSCSPEELRDLERSFRVPYDAAHSRGLEIPVPGLGPRTHRFQSLGHDPILGFVIGTADILMGTMTAVDSSGRLVRQVTESAPIGMSLFEAIARQFGHLQSDAPTPAGLPAPLTPLLQFLRVGSFGKDGRTIGDVSRLMYAKGYDFGHFLAMSVAPLLIEVLVRSCYCIKRLSEGRDLIDAVPVKLPGQHRPPKLHTMLFTAHLIATAANAGRVCLGPAFNPLAINYPQWVAFTKYSLSQLRWVLVEKEDGRIRHAQERIEADWATMSSSLDAWWTEVGALGMVVELG